MINNSEFKNNIIQNIYIDGLPEEKKNTLGQKIFAIININLKKKEKDLNIIFNNIVKEIMETGHFNKIDLKMENNNLIINVQMHPILNKIKIKFLNNDGDTILSQEDIDLIFNDSYNKIINVNEIELSAKELEKFFINEGYTLTKLVNIELHQDNTIILIYNIHIINDIIINYFDSKKDNQKVEGLTKDYIILRELKSKKGNNFNGKFLEEDIIRLRKLNLFKDIKVAIQNIIVNDCNKINIIMNIEEESTRSLGGGLNLTQSGGLGGLFSYSTNNCYGKNINQSLNLNWTFEKADIDFSYFNPWVNVNDYKRALGFNLKFDLSPKKFGEIGSISASANLLNKSSENLINNWCWFNQYIANIEEVDLENKKKYYFKNGGGPELTKLEKKDRQSLISGINKYTISNTKIEGMYKSGIKIDTYSELFYNMDNSNTFNKSKIGFSLYKPIKNFLFRFNFNIGGGIGVLPWYESFFIGGNNGIRGYDYNNFAFGEYYTQGTFEVYFPFKSMLGELFFDFGKIYNPEIYDFDQSSPTSGYSYGTGIITKTPIGPIRIELASKDSGNFKLGANFGEKF